MLNHAFYTLYLWIDLLWIPIAFFTVHKKHRWLAFGFVLSCIIMMHLQVEVMESISYPTGILPFIESHVNFRLLIIYSVFYIGFLIMAHFSPNTEKIVFLGASIGIFFMVFTVSSVLMLL